MRFFLHSLVLGLFFSHVIFAQTPQPTATPEVDDEIVKISTNLIQIDVTPTDRRGRIVSDLKAEDFEVFENGIKQKITDFSFISLIRYLNKVKKTNLEENGQISIPAPVTVNRSQNRRTVALVVDDLTLSSSSMAAVRKGLRKYVNEQMLPGDFVAIVKTGGGSGAIQQFTSDKRKLNNAIKRLRWNPNGNGGISVFEPLGGLTGSGIPPREDSIPKLFQSIKDLIKSMKPMPGRKSVMLLSDGFSLTVNPSLELETTVRNESDTTTNRNLSIARELIKLANRSSVVIYAMDARGVGYTGITAASNTSALGGSPGRNPAIGQAVSNRRNTLAETQSGLKFVAEQTGGFLIRNNNDIGNGIRKIVQDQSYYLIAYDPGDEIFDANTRRFNTLVVKVKRKGVKVRHRSGFFGESESDDSSSSVTSSESKIVSAIKSPYSVNNINLNLNALFTIDDKQKMFVRSFLHIDSNDLKFKDEADGKKTAAVEILSVSINEKGNVEDQFSKSHKITVSPKRYEKMKSEGLIYYFVFPIAKDGAHEMRVALRDEVTGKTGTASQYIEIPKLKEKQLNLSGIVLENFTDDEWRKRQAGNANMPASTPLLDNALRRFSPNSVLTYGFEIYNARLVKNKLPDLVMRTRLFYDGKVIYEGKDSPVTGPNRILKISSAAGALKLQPDLAAGEYVLQVIVTDKLAKKKRQIATQFIQFEIVEQKRAI